jgi:hypothetical protein
MEQLTIIPCPADGSCFFHSVLLASSQEYREERIGNNRVPKAQIARQFRDDLARLLEMPIREALNWYEYLSRGQLPLISVEMPEFSLNELQIKLRSGRPIGAEFHQLVSEAMNKDIYIFDGSKGSLYNIGDEELLYDHRPSIVLYYKNEHYDLLARDKGNGEMQMVFEPNDEIIQKLKE